VKNPTVLVTGAGGFVGREVVRVLHNNGARVRACVHAETKHGSVGALYGVEQVGINILDRPSLMNALNDIDAVYHFAALVDSSATREELIRVNVEGTRTVWKCAAARGVKRALYCSTTAVYGLLAGSNGMITEDVPAKAVEPYGSTKLMGEQAALDVAAETGLHTTIIRPAAIFGPGEHTPFGRQLRNAAYSRLLVAGGFQNRRFSFVHVEDVARAAVHLMQRDLPGGEIFNVAGDTPILFEEAFSAYIRALRRAGRSYAKIRFLALASTLLHKLPPSVVEMTNRMGERHVFRLWHPGFDLNYSSRKLLATEFAFRRKDFEEILTSCIT
jgi:nucleoside-diphosphate-sugar epimerase